MDIGGLEIGTAFLVTAILIIGIWILIEIKRLKHKIFAVSLILLILFFYISLTYSLKNQNVDLKTVPGIIKAGKIYFMWLGSIYGNVKTITSNAVKMNWGIKQNSSRR